MAEGFYDQNLEEGQSAVFEIDESLFSHIDDQ